MAYDPVTGEPTALPAAAKGWRPFKEPEQRPVWQYEVDRLRSARKSRAKIIEEIAIYHPNTPVGELIEYLDKIGAY